MIPFDNLIWSEEIVDWFLRAFRVSSGGIKEIQASVGYKVSISRLPLVEARQLGYASGWNFNQDKSRALGWRWDHVYLSLLVIAGWSWTRFLFFFFSCYLDVPELLLANSWRNKVLSRVSIWFWNFSAISVIERLCALPTVSIPFCDVTGCFPF